MSPKDFINAIATAAKQSMRETKIPASFVIAEAALESGWGEHCPGFNLFGVKADRSWTGPSITKKTREFIGGHPIMENARFRAYQDWLGSIEDHAKFIIRNPRYEKAFSFSDGESFAKSVAESGYATDPDYAEKIISIMKKYNLSVFDN